jgi:hypothetical protein
MINMELDYGAEHLILNLVEIRHVRKTQKFQIYQKPKSSRNSYDKQESIANWEDEGGAIK